MKPGTIYRITHQCYDPTNDIQEIVDISDNDNLIEDSEVATVIDLIPAGDPVTCAVHDADEDVFNPVKPQKLTIRFNSESGAENMNTFASGSDNRWSVHDYIGSRTLFKGFLVLDDLREDFMCEPNVVILTATDGLNLLSDIPLVDFNDENPVGEYKIAELLAMCLRQTGTPLEIRAAFNIKHSGAISDISVPGTSGQHFFNITYLDAKTFEDEIGTSINCLEVIKRILGEEATLFQRNGAYYIMRIDEIEHPTRGLYISTFDSEGVFIENLGEVNYEKNVGKDSPYKIFFSRETTGVQPTRPHKRIKLIYNFNPPKEIVENIDFERGDLLTTVSATEKLYSIADWGLFRNTGSGLDAPGTSAYIRRIFENDYEKERYAVIVPGTQQDYYLISSRIPVGIKDRFEFSVSVSYNAEIYPGSSPWDAQVAQLRLYANDGTRYTFDGGTLLDEQRGWVACATDFSNNQQYYVIEGDGDDDDTEWSPVSSYGTTKDTTIPKDGYIVIVLRANYLTDTYETRFTDVRFDYIPYINGSYQKYTAQSQEVTQAGNYKAKREDSVYVSDSPRRLFKGSFLKALLYVDIFSGSVQFFAASSSFQISGYHLGIFRKGQRINIQNTTSNNIQGRILSVSYSLVGTLTVITVDATLVNETDATTTIQEMTFALANEFYNAAVFPTGPPSAEYIHPYSEIQIHDVANQFLNDKRVFQATLQGIDLAEVDGNGESNSAHIINKWIFTDVTENTFDRFFTLMTFDQNHRTGEWNGVFKEVYHVKREKSYLNRSFKFIS